jgi:putative DNA primase/helicase
MSQEYENPFETPTDEFEEAEMYQEDIFNSLSAEDIEKNVVVPPLTGSVQVENIPAELKEVPQWVAWEYRLIKERLNKVPVNPNTGANASSTDSSTWGSFGDALNFMRSRHCNGIGFVVTETDDFVFIDLDKCRDPETKQTEQWALDMIEKFNSYTEISPSGKGYHIWVKGAIPPGKKKGNDGKLEIYKTGRYATFTGDHVTNTPRVIRECQIEIDDVYRIYFPTCPKTTQPAKPVPEQSLDIDAVLAKAFASKNGPEIKILFDGDKGEHPTQSEADNALCKHLVFWFGKDPQIVDQVFRRSGLYRPKWDELRGAETYGQTTINKAIDSVKNTYTPSNSEDLKIDIEAVKAKAATILDAGNKIGSYDTSLLPGILAEYVDHLCTETDAEPIIIVSSVLGSLSALVKKRVFYQYFGKKPLYPNLWMLTISPSGMFKTTALDLGSRLVEYRHLEILDQMKSVKADNDLEKKQLQEDILSRSPKLPNKITPEKLLSRLATNAGGLIINSEFGEWLEGLGRSYNLGLKPLYTAFFDIPSSYENDTKGDGLQIIKEPFISISAMSTIEWVKKTLNETDITSGFFARFLLFNPPYTPRIPRALPDENESGFGSLLPIEQRLLDIIDNLPKKRKKYKFDQNDRKYFEECHHYLYQYVSVSKQKSDLYTPYLKRWSPYLLKLSMLFQTVMDPISENITREALDSGLSVMKYAIDSTKSLIEKDLIESRFETSCRKVYEYIAGSGGVVTRKVLAGSRVLKGGVKDHYDPVFKQLEDEGKIVIQKNGKMTEWKYVLAN